MNTEIHRLPGAFNLPADWPRVAVGNILSGLWAEYVGDDLEPANTAATFPTSGTTMKLPWRSRTGEMALTAAAGTTPNVAQIADRFNGHRYASFTGSMGAVTAALPEGYTGPLTMSAYVYAFPNSRANTLFSTSAAGAGYYAVGNNADSTQLLLTASATGTTPTTLSIPISPDSYFPVIACFNGAASYIRVGDATVTGTLPAAPATVLKMGNNAANTAGWNGRVAHMRVYRRALTADEATLTVADLRRMYS